MSKRKANDGLCHSCEKFKPFLDAAHHCQIAQRIHVLCGSLRTVALITKCPSYKEKEA